MKSSPVTVILRDCPELAGNPNLAPEARGTLNPDGTVRIANNDWILSPAAYWRAIDVTPSTDLLIALSRVR